METSSGKPRRPFHWILEFPEVFLREQGGFDAIVGNPPYMGGRVITSKMGNAYYRALDHVRFNAYGSPDLAVFFLLRGFYLTRSNGYLGYVTTNAIKDTGNRDVGLGQVTTQGGRIYSADPDLPWPGTAAVVVSRFSIRKGGWLAACNLSGRATDFISNALDEVPDENPNRLLSMRDIKSDGFKLMGEGFVLTEDEAGNILSVERDAEFCYQALLWRGRYR